MGRRFGHGQHRGKARIGSLKLVTPMGPGLRQKQRRELPEHGWEGLCVILYSRAFETPLVLMYTSGTTGKPKGALLPHGMLSQFSRSYASSPQWEDWQPDDVAISVLPNFHVQNAGQMLTDLFVRAPFRDCNRGMIKCDKIQKLPGRARAGQFLMDMSAPGVTARQIRQITGDEEFAEVFLYNVRIPVANRLGAEGEGWKVAQTTLSSERGLIAVELIERTQRAAWRLHAALDALPSPDGGYRRQIAMVRVKLDAFQAMISQTMERTLAGQEAPGESSYIKQFYAEVLREFTQLGLSMQGIEGQIRDPMILGAGHETGNWMVDFQNSYMWTIAGGTNEIQRNIISERLLGMARESA